METVDQTQVTMDKLTRVYIKMRDRIKELNLEVENIKAQQAGVAGAMKDLLQSVGGKSMGTTYGNVSVVTKTRYYAQDWDAMKRFIVDNDALYLLEARIAQTNMATFLEKNPGLVPPSLGTMSELTVSV